MFNKYLLQFFLIISIIILFYIFYKSEIYWNGSIREYYSIHYFISISLILFSVSLFFLSEKYKTYVTIIILSSLSTIYFFEGYLVSKVYFHQKYINKIYFEKNNQIYDRRSKVEFYSDLSNQYDNVAMSFVPANLIDKKNINILPLSGKSFSKTIHCNENGYYSVYDSDRYGFNNPDKEWDKNFVEFILVGDSYLQGACVNRPDDISSTIRNLSEGAVLNLGMRSNGPLLEFASLKEYYKKNTKNIVWIYYEGNDIEDLYRELSNKILTKYLLNENFSQNLLAKQKNIDEISSTKVPKKNKSFILNNPVLNFLKLNQLRYNIKVFIMKSNVSEVKDKDSKLNTISKFRDLLSLTKNFADKNNSNLIFVYLPYSLRYDEIVKQEKYYETFDKKDYFKIKEILKDLDIKFIDTHTEVFSKRDNPLEFFPFKKPNTHYTSEAYKLIGELIYNRTKQN